MITIEGPGHRSSAVKSVFHCGISAARQQELYYLYVPSLGGFKERSCAVAKFRVHVSALVEQGRRSSQVAPANGLPKLIVKLLPGTLPKRRDPTKQQKERKEELPSDLHKASPPF